MQFELEAFAQGAALLDRALVREDLSCLFDPQALQAQAISGGRGAIWQVHGSFGTAALRHYRRGGLLAALRKDRYWYRSAEQTRAFSELRLLAHMHAAGLPVPRPLAARYQRSGLIYRADLLTAWLPCARPLAELYPQFDLKLFEMVGHTIGRFHRAGIWHADLNSHNIVQCETGIALLDFDRGQLRAPRRDWQQANLQRLERSLRKLGLAAHPEFSRLWLALHTAHQQELAA